MNASVLGLSKEEIDARFDDIAAFADIGQFIEQPVKTYSSGMYVRLAFSVIAHVDADILVYVSEYRRCIWRLIWGCLPYCFLPARCFKKRIRYTNLC